ncbi:MAG: ferritin-like domain-containing protein [Isosphaeraceae bacterium]
MRALIFNPTVKVLSDEQVEVMSRAGSDVASGARRRSFLRDSLAGVAASALGVAGVLGGPREASAGEKHGHRRLPSLYANWNRRNFREILADEASHVEIISTLLDDEDNPLMPKIRAMPMLRDLAMPDEVTFAEAAATFENTGTGVYAGALFAIQQTDEYFPTAAGLTTVEARHAGYLNTLLNQAIVPSFAAVDSPIPQAVALSRVEPFIAELNGSVPSFDPVNASDANNFRILDFLLLLEMVETAFYQVNVARFFH